MARPIVAASARPAKHAAHNKAKSSRTQLVDSSEEEEEEEEGDDSGSGSGSGSEAGTIDVNKAQGSSRGGNTSSKRRAVIDDGDTASDEDEEDSQNVAVGAGRRGVGTINNNKKTAATVGQGRTGANGAEGGKGSGPTRPHHKTPLAPLQLNAHAQPSSSSSISLGTGAPGGQMLRSPVRTVSLNDTHTAGNRRRLSGGRGAFTTSGPDSLRRKSLPSSLRKVTNGTDHTGGRRDSMASATATEEDGAEAESAGDASFASAASASKGHHKQKGVRHTGQTATAGNGHKQRPAHIGKGMAAGAAAPSLLRRTSAGHALHGASGASGSSGGGGGIGALNAANALRRHASGNGDAPLPLPVLSLEAMNTNYEEWMKMATDNKINSSNTWSFALIDYFHDMSLLRNADDEGSINFQKASCTLDGCVKIWTSRVDSIATETGRLLNGLAGDAAAAAEDAESTDDEDGDGGADGDGDAEGRQKRPKRARPAHATTLADSFAKIQVKDLELEFTVDPLFKKTSADFDEGGAAGLLMNHLSSDSTMRVVFDAGDAKVEDDEDEQDGHANAREGSKGENQKHSQVNLSKLRAAFLPDSEALETKHICPSLSAFKFSSDPTLLDMSLFSRGDLGASTSAGVQDPNRSSTYVRAGSMAASESAEFAAAIEGAGTQDFFADAGNDFNMVYDDFGGGADDHDMGGHSDNEDDDGSGVVAHQGAGVAGMDAAAGANGHALGAMQRFDPRLNIDQREVVIGMGGDEGEKQVFSYFDSQLAKNWAGPEHWKMRKTIRRSEQDAHEGGEGAAAAAAAGKKGKKVAKEAFQIDFANLESAADAKKIFASGTASITMPAPKRKRGTFVEKKEDFLLPDDMHFSSQQLLRLFMKPKAAVHMRRRLQRLPVPRVDGEVDEHYWAAAAAAAAAQAGDGIGGEAGEDDESGPMLPFDTQFFHDDGDAPDFDEDLPMGGDEFEGLGDSNNLPDPGAAGPLGNVASGEGSGAEKRDEEEDLLAATQGQLKRARPQTVNYAKKSKRVDVKKLKENIWKELALDKLPKRNRPDQHPDDCVEEDGEDVNPEQAPREFQSVISGLRKAYPEDKMEEISTSFCFICLLHLANEQGLRIQSDQFSSDLPSSTSSSGSRRGGSAPQQQLQRQAEDDREEAIKFVGRLDRLKVAKEITA